jgi:hypothetical protein
MCPNHQGRRDARADRDEEHVPAVAAGAEAGLGDPAHPHVVAERGGQAEPRGEQVPQRYVPEADVRRPDRHAVLLVDHAGHRDAHGDRVEAVGAGLAGQAGRDVEDGGGDRLRPAFRGRPVALGVVDRAVRADQRALHPGPADVEGDDNGFAHVRTTERVRLRGRSGSRPWAVASRTATRWASTRSAIGSSGARPPHQAPSAA